MIDQLPQIWLDEIAKGSEFGKRVQKQMAKRRPAGNQQRPYRPKVKDHTGIALLKAFETALGRPIGCGACKNTLVSFDRAGLLDIEAAVDKIYRIGLEIPEAISPRGSEPQRAWIRGVVASVVAAQNQPRPIRAKRNRHAYTGWRSEADGPPIEHGPFVSSIRHLTYFVYGRSEASWKWNLDQLAKRWWLFNGKKILGIAHDQHTATPQAVIDYAASLGMVFDHVLTAPNNEKLRETVLWVPMLRLLNPESAGANEVVFSAHAKGQKYDDPKHTRDWCDIMYQTCLDDWPAVYNALRTALMAGSFREYGLLGKWHNWAYSGSYYFFRLSEIGKRKWYDVDQWFAGTESWPGKMCEARETACLFLNDSRRLYDKHYWESTVWPEWQKYQEARRGR